ncbi:MAG: hypothetical protein IJ708_02405 [Clostridia bacterium]|nr:hypothetical protein [Clostridia bacterium]
MDFLFVLVAILLVVVNAAQKSKKKNAAPKVQYPRTDPGNPLEAAQTASVQETVQETVQKMAPPELPAQPTVSVSAHHHEDMYAGSLHADLLEGDPESFDLMPSAHSAELFVETEESANAVDTGSGLHLDFTGNALVNAFVLQEVLKRPGERRSVRYAG